MNILTVEKITNGLLADVQFEGYKHVKTFHPNWSSLLKSIDNVWGEIEREVLKIREEENKK